MNYTFVSFKPNQNTCDIQEMTTNFQFVTHAETIIQKLKSIVTN